MKLKILYFASLREALGQAAEEIALPTAVSTIGGLRDHLAARGGAWEALAANSLRVAVNQQIADADKPLAEGDEVAFFPPVTGG